MAKSNGEVGHDLKQENEDDNDYWIVVNAILRYIFLSVADWIDESWERKKHFIQQALHIYVHWHPLIVKNFLKQRLENVIFCAPLSISLSLFFSKYFRTKAKKLRFQSECDEEKEKNIVHETKTWKLIMVCDSVWIHLISFCFSLFCQQFWVLVYQAKKANFNTMTNVLRKQNVWECSFEYTKTFNWFHSGVSWRTASSDFVRVCVIEEKKNGWNRQKMERGGRGREKENAHSVRSKKCIHQIYY